MRSKKILITGGAGFIGSRLACRLDEAGCDVRVLDNLSPQIHGQSMEDLKWLTSGRIEFIRGSVEDHVAFKHALEGMEIVVHLAAETGTGQSMYEIARYNSVNSQGTAVLFDVLASQRNRSTKRIILASSRSIYGEGAYVDRRGSRVYPAARSASFLAAHRWDPVDEADGQPLRAAATLETDPACPASIYAATKLAQENLQRIACESLNIGYATLRLQNVYGEGQSLGNPYTGILSIFSTRIRRGLAVSLFEDGEESRDFVHVDDVVSAFVRCIERDAAPNSAINVGSGRPTSIRKIAEMLFDSFGIQQAIRVTGEYRLGDIRHNWADISRLRELLDFEPNVDLVAGIKRFCNWVLNQPLPEDQFDRANLELQSRNLMGR